MGVLLGCGLDQLIHNVLGGRTVPVPHAHFDDVFAAATGRHLELAGDIEYVWRQALDPRKWLHDVF